MEPNLVDPVCANPEKVCEAPVAMRDSTAYAKVSVYY